MEDEGASKTVFTRVRCRTVDQTAVEEQAVSYTHLKRAEPMVLRDAAVADWGRMVSVRDAKAHLSALLEWVAF